MGGNDEAGKGTSQVKWMAFDDDLHTFVAFQGETERFHCELFEHSEFSQCSGVFL
jgi:hypothetical protein